jgi:hypothetical protein
VVYHYHLHLLTTSLLMIMAMVIPVVVVIVVMTEVSMIDAVIGLVMLILADMVMIKARLESPHLCLVTMMLSLRVMLMIRPLDLMGSFEPYYCYDYDHYYCYYEGDLAMVMMALTLLRVQVRNLYHEL